MPGKQLRERLFNVYAANLALAKRQWPHLPEVADHFLCPLCRTLFDRTALDDPVRITLEHSIPEALGGAGADATLTCTRCNNRSGSSLDVHLKNRLDAEEFFRGTSNAPARARINVGGYDAAVDWVRQGGEN